MVRNVQQTLEIAHDFIIKNRKLIEYKMENKSVSFSVVCNFILSRHIFKLTFKPVFGDCLFITVALY